MTLAIALNSLPRLTSAYINYWASVSEPPLTCRYALSTCIYIYIHLHCIYVVMYIYIYIYIYIYMFEAFAYFSRLPYSCLTQPVASDTMANWGNAGERSSVRGQLGSPHQAA